MSLKESYKDFIRFEIGNIVWDDDYDPQRGEEAPEPEVRTFVSRDEPGAGGLEEDTRTVNQEAIDRFEESAFKITFEYANPSVGIDVGANFVKHDIIGGPTVRQKIGTKPMQISVKGIAKQQTAQSLELLRNAKEGTLISDRFAKDAVTVHIVSITTDPMDDGGAADLNDGEFLYTFSLECVELYESGQ